MEIKKYKETFPSEHIDWLRTSHSSFIYECMLQVGKGFCLDNCFEGGFLHLSIIDYTHFKWIKTKKESIDMQRFSHFYFPFRMFNNPAKDESHLQLRLSQLTPKQRKEWEDKISKIKIDYPTVEEPIKIQMSTVDDLYYVKIVSCISEAREIVANLEELQPLEYDYILSEGFIATS